MAESDNKLKNTNAPSQPKSDVNRLSHPGKTPGPPGTNPFGEARRTTTGGTGNVNPSAPTTGTEQWGLGPNEGKTTGTSQGKLPTQDHGDSELDEAHSREITFRCADTGNADCRWETSARTEDELMDNFERHGREAHGVKDFDDSTRQKVLNAVRERRAA